jgi:hypothetical protein
VGFFLQLKVKQCTLTQDSRGYRKMFKKTSKGRNSPDRLPIYKELYLPREEFEDELMIGKIKTSKQGKMRQLVNP